MTRSRPARELPPLDPEQALRRLRDSAAALSASARAIPRDLPAERHVKIANAFDAATDQIKNQLSPDEGSKS